MGGFAGRSAMIPPLHTYLAFAISFSLLSAHCGKAPGYLFSSNSRHLQLDHRLHIHGNIIWHVPLFVCIALCYLRGF